MSSYLKLWLTFIVARQQKYLRAKIGGVEEKMDDDAEEEEETERVVWGRAKNIFYNDDNIDYEVRWTSLSTKAIILNLN